MLPIQETTFRLLTDHLDQSHLSSILAVRNMVLLSTSSTRLSPMRAQLFENHSSTPLPAGLTPPQPPRTNFLGRPAMSGLLGTKLKAGTHRAVLELLNDLHQTRHLAELAGKGDVVT